MSEIDKSSYDTKIAIGELGTQFWHYNTTSKKFDYALPLIDGGGGEYGGDTTTYPAPEMDLPYEPKISGRTSLNDVELVSNYTSDKMLRWREILNSKINQIYLEVFSDNSAYAYAGTSGMPTITRGNPRTITVTIAPSNIVFVPNINNVDEQTYSELKDLLGLDAEWTEGYQIPFDETTIPNKRVEFFDGNGGKSNASMVNDLGL